MPMLHSFRDEFPRRSVGASQPGGLLVHRPGDPGRREVERFIAQIYAARHGANLCTFAPTLVSLRQGSGIVAAAGYPAASNGPLFLERYLDQPVQALLPEGNVGPPARESIVEVATWRRAGLAKGHA